jgi:hypothetical protein
VTKFGTKPDQRTEVDSDLITMFLRMSPEERIKTNDNSIRAILDLRDAFRKKESSSSRS